MRRVAVAGAVAGRAAWPLALAAVALGSPDDPLVGNWIVVDAAGGLLVGVIGVVGLASVLVSPAYLRDAGRRSSRAAPRGRARTTSSLYAFWAVLARGPLAGNLGARVAAGRGDDRGVGAARRLQRQGRGRSRRAGST